MIKNLVKEAVEVNPSDLFFDESNENHHSDDQIKMLMHSIEKSGFYNPILAEAGTCIIVAGHGRVMAAKRLKMKKVPVIFKEYANEGEKAKDRIKDNMSARESILSMPMITETIIRNDYEGTVAFDWGMTQKTLDEKMLAVPPEEKEKACKEPKVCPKCGHEF